ncbi:MAG: hypothetical protein OJJ21_10680 [Ferrovibrio sp.]|uniref:hypothetical protein n=1 Tax=Ferrovibrio sp. TaxID=1917215 RepID=UPI002621B912|nr:hypothetical protein [Ferrovibrio sp.]MCW0234053.1 hypothetical protein [Ferrovibrio sp.]
MEQKISAVLPAAIPLHQMAARLRKQHAGKIAVLVDLSAIPNIHSRIMFRSMARFIEERSLGEPIDAVPLARNILVLLAVPEVMQRLRDKLESLSESLREQRHGSLGLREFDMESQANSFVDAARRVMEQSPAPPSERVVPQRDEPPPDLEALSKVIDVHSILWQADLANQRRRQTIWTLVPNQAPLALADETWVSIAAVERAMGISLRDNIWLFGKATELLDQRIIAQIMAENASLRRPLSINLHLVSVISTAFLRLLTEKPAANVRQIMVEIPLVEWQTHPSLAETARQILDRHGVKLCLDGIHPENVAGLSEQDWQAADYLKFDATADLLSRQTAELQSLSPQHQEMLRHKGIFCHCDSTGAIAAGIGLGVQHYQGRGLRPLLEDIDAVQQLLGIEAAEGATAALKGL